MVEAARDAGVVFLRPAGPVLVEEAAVEVGGERCEAGTVGHGGGRTARHGMASGSTSP
ncbi:hypothetical protein [Streptomyces sp. NPDC001787]|uniref:hypothetical protein n=1 Tax=Streptomyces sp. NPDC001787 TaxID=3154523 RepID=UPI003322C3DE